MTMLPAPPSHDPAPAAAALDFLRKMQRADGFWYDFYTLAGQSNYWVSGVVAHALARHGAGVDAIAVDRALQALAQRQRPGGGWSYNQQVPSDCDSSAWVLLALLQRGASKSSTLLRAARYLLRHQQRPGGGFSTYTAADGIERFIDARPDQTEGWRAPHVGVSCTAVQALLDAGANARAPRLAAALAYIAGRRPAGGLWTCYWWAGHGYATYHALRALIRGDALDGAAACEVAAAILRRQQDDGGWLVNGRPAALETAMMLRALQLLAHGEPAVWAPLARARRALAAGQNHDGSFAAAPMLRIPPPTVADPVEVMQWRVDQAGTGVLVSDSERVFTTACVLGALSLPCWTAR